MLVSALGVPATHRLTTMPLTGGGPAADAPIPGPCLPAMSASVRLRGVPPTRAIQSVVAAWMCSACCRRPAAKLGGLESEECVCIA